jgi:pericentriolar material 1 protein
VQCPKINTQQLHNQISAMMTEILPLMRAHYNDVCSSQLLHRIKLRVLELAQSAEGGRGEFERFFHKQLQSILHESLVKYEGRK